MGHGNAIFLRMVIDTVTGLRKTPKTPVWNGGRTEMNPLKFDSSSYNAKWSSGRLFGMGVHFTRGRIGVGSFSDRKALNKKQLVKLSNNKRIQRFFGVFFAEIKMFPGLFGFDGLGCNSISNASFLSMFGGVF